MKLRIRGNSIRLRLGESEVAQLVNGGFVSESIQFSASPESHLTYSVVTSPNIKEITARLADGEIKVTAPEGLGREWANSEQVGIEHSQPINSASSLSILIEKDFRCLDPRPGEDQSDTFTNPARGKSCNPS